MIEMRKSFGRQLSSWANSNPLSLLSIIRVLQLTQAMKRPADQTPIHTDSQKTPPKAWDVCLCHKDANINVCICVCWPVWQDVKRYCKQYCSFPSGGSRGGGAPGAGAPPFCFFTLFSYIPNWLRYVATPALAQKTSAQCDIERFSLVPRPHPRTDGWDWDHDLLSMSTNKSIAARRLSACVCSIDPRTSGTCGANHEGATTAHPDNWKMKAKNFFRALRGLIGATRLCKIPAPPLHKILYPPLFPVLVVLQTARKPHQ